MTEKKNGDYEKPESLGEEEELEGVTGAGSKYPYAKEDEPNPWKCNKGGALEKCRSGFKYYG